MNNNPPESRSDLWSDWLLHTRHAGDPEQERAIRAGIPVTVFDSGVNVEDYVTFVATDNYGAGCTAARLLPRQDAPRRRAGEQPAQDAETEGSVPDEDGGSGRADTGRGFAHRSNLSRSYNLSSGPWPAGSSGPEPN